MAEPATHTSPVEQHFHQVVAPVLFAEASTSSAPTLTILASPGSTGRSRALTRFAADAVALNAADLRVLAPEGDAASAAVLLQLALAHAREQGHSVALDGQFRTPALVSGLSRLFTSFGYSTRLVVIAERDSEVRMSDASSRLLAWRRGETEERSPSRGAASVLPLVTAATEDATAVRDVVILSRSGTVVFDSSAGDRREAASAFEAAAAERLGTLRSTLWLSQLRHMTRFVASQRSAPRWALDNLIDLHELALTEIVPELPIPADSETRQIQNERLTATLSALRESVSAEVPDSATLQLPTPTPAGPRRSL